LPAKLLAAKAAGVGRRAQAVRRQHGQADARERTAADDAAQPRRHPSATAAWLSWGEAVYVACPT